MRPWVKYLIYQVPGWVLIIVILIALRHWLELSPRIAIVVFLLWVIKDFALYPLLRKSFEPSGETPLEQMIGLQGVAKERIDPRGYIQVRGELWHAQIPPGGDPIPAGRKIRVVGADGIKLIITDEVAR